MVNDDFEAGREYQSLCESLLENERLLARKKGVSEERRAIAVRRVRTDLERFQDLHRIYQPAEDRRYSEIVERHSDIMTRYCVSQEGN